MVRFSRAFFWALVVGAAMVAIGCPSLSSVQHFSDEDGKGGGTTTATTGTGGSMPCSPTVPCVDNNPCTTEACTNGFCIHAPLDMSMGPGSNECITIACVKGAPTTTIHDGKACGGSGKLKCIGEVCTGCTGDADCGKTDECQTSTCQSDKTCKYDPKPIGTKVVNDKLPARNVPVGPCTAWNPASAHC